MKSDLPCYFFIFMVMFISCKMPKVALHVTTRVLFRVIQANSLLVFLVLTGVLLHLGLKVIYILTVS